MRSHLSRGRLAGLAALARTREQDLASSRAAEPSAAEWRRRNAPAVGIMLGLALSAPLWAVIALVVRMLRRL